MHELDAYPHVKALLVELFELTPEDQLLPAEVLINLHRPVLRRALEELARLAAGRNYIEWQDQLVSRYFFGETSALFRNDDELEAVFDESGNWDAVDSGVLQLGFAPDVVDLIKQNNEDWLIFDPVVELHRISWPGTKLQAVIKLLDLELSIHPGVRQMLVDLTRGTNLLLL